MYIRTQADSSVREKKDDLGLFFRFLRNMVSQLLQNLKNRKSGLIIANLGIIGIYLGKVFDETKKRPLYVISKRINI